LSRKRGRRSHPLKRFSRKMARFSEKQWGNPKDSQW
jgi:hypothetical protein